MVAEQRIGREAELLHARERERAAGAVAGVDHELHVRAGELDAGRDHLDVLVLHVDPREAAGRGGGDVALLLDERAQGLDVGAEEARLAAHHLEAVLVARVVAAGDHDAAVDVQAEDRGVEHGRGADPDLDHVHPALDEAVDEGGKEPVARQATVPSDRDAELLARLARPEDRAEAPAYGARHLVGEVAVGDAPDVVLAETLGRDLHGRAMWRGQPPPRKSWLGC